MKINVAVLNVGDGDAIILSLTKPTGCLVIVIDGGEETHFENVVKDQLKAILKQHKKLAPDIVICSHYDSDHVGGLLPLIEYYKENIQEVWVAGDEDNKLYENIESLTKKVSLVGDCNTVMLNRELESSILDSEEKGALLESVRQYSRLLRLVPAEKLIKMHADKRSKIMNDWPELKILGPTKEYFKMLFPKDTPLLEYLDTRKPNKLLENATNALAQNPCERLKTDSQTFLSKVNLSSLIIAIDSNKGRYLFTADAGIKSFKAIPKWETGLKDLYFLKVPHHGSNNNLTKEMIELMNPVYAYCSGDSYQDDEVLACLAQKSRNNEVQSTKGGEHLYFSG